MFRPDHATILIIDDDPAVISTFARMLSREGYRVRTAPDAESAWREVESIRPDAILLDLRMPHVDGLAFLRHLRTRHDQRDTPVAVVTGHYVLDNDVVCALDECHAGLYFKPLWLEDLVSITQRLLTNGVQQNSPSQRLPHRLNLLFVDDCAAERNWYEVALAREFNVLTASRGDEGVTLAAQAQPDAIVLDVMMPGMDGWEACTTIKCNAITADIPVILLTGADDGDLTQHAMAVGAPALLRRPCSAHTLRNAILTAVKGDAQGGRDR